MPVDDITRATTKQAGGQRDYITVCTVCSEQTELPAYACPRCSGPIVLQLAPVQGQACRDLPNTEATGIWRRAQLLPRTKAAVSLGEGATPLVPFQTQNQALIAGQIQCWLKAEHLNPTLSFKDRAMALGISMALDQQATGLVLASSGNAAVSAAAYAAAARRPCRIFCGTSSGAATKVALAGAYGAEVSMVDGDYSTAYAAAVAAERDGWVNVTTTYRNPVLAEAYRTVAAEIVTALGDAPELVVIPVGAGPLLHGMRRGFQDTLDARDSTRLPRLVGVQAQACAPLARAWMSEDWLATLRCHTEVGSTAATAIADAMRGYEEQGLITLSDVRDTGGTLVAVDEDAIAAAQRELRAAGHMVEAAAATALAALDTAGCGSLLAPGSTVVLMMTGHGAKEPMA